MNRYFRYSAALVLTLLLIGSGCSSDDTNDSATTVTGESVTTEANDTTVTSEDDTTSTTDADTTEPDDSSDSTDPTDKESDDESDEGGSGGGELPGEPFDGFAAEGDVLAVVGVAHDDELNLRAVPGENAEVVATAAPTADDLVATGRARNLPDSIWYEVTSNDTTGWVGSRFVAFLGATDNATAEFMAGGPPTEGATMVALAEPIVDFYSSDQPPSLVVQSVAPTTGDLGEVTYDVVGIGDDAVGGYRLHIFGQPLGSGFVLDSIERTYLCPRGVSGEFCS